MNEFIKEELKQIQGMLRNGYNIDDLTEADKETVWDMAYLITCVSTDVGDECEDDSLLDKMVNEIKQNHEEEIKWNLRDDVAYFVISRLDSYDEEGKKENKAIKTDARLKFAPPWVTFANKVKAMFGDDPDTTVVYENAVPKVIVTVNGTNKAAAIAALLPTEKKIGNVTLYVEVTTRDGSPLGEVSVPAEKAELFETAFKNNPAFSFTRCVDYAFITNKITYVVFANRVVQFFNDNLNDNFGNISTLYQEIAKDIFDPDITNGVFYSTDIAKGFTMPLGEWP